MFDAYTIKKVLPRLVVAVILIQLSWFLFSGMIELIARVSYGIEGLILAPFGGADQVSLVGIFNEAGLGVGAGIGGLALAGAVGVVAAGGPIALLIIVSLALLVGFFVLVVRRVLLVALLILSPIALVAWILPGTERAWKIWWDNFSKLLLMFPLIMIILTVGRVFAYVYASTIDQPGIMEMFVIVICVFAPIAMIPLTYKAAGLGLGFIAGAIKGAPDQWGKSARERGRKKGAERRKRWREDAGREALFGPNTPGAAGLNKWASRIAAPVSNLALASAGKGIPFLSGKGDKIAAGLHHKQVEQTGKLMQELNNLHGMNDMGYRALAGLWGSGSLSDPVRTALDDAGLLSDDGTTYKKGFGSREDLTTLSTALLASDNENERIAGAAIQGAIPRLVSAYSDPEIGYGNLQAASFIGLASHGFAEEEDFEQIGQALSGEHGGLGGAQSFLAQAALASNRAGRADLKPGYGYGVSKPGDGETRFVGGSELSRDDSWVDTMTAQDLAGSKGKLLKAREDLLVDIIRKGSDKQSQAALEVVDGARKDGMTDAEIEKVIGKEDFERAKHARRANDTAAKLQSAASQYGGGVEVSGRAASILARGGRSAGGPAPIDPSLLMGGGEPPQGDPGAGGGEGGSDPFGGGTT